MSCSNKLVSDWVAEQAAYLKPDSIRWISGSEQEAQDIAAELVANGTFKKVNESVYPNSYWSLSDPSDVARVEDRTYICSADKADAGPLNNWRDPAEMKSHLRSIMTGSMQGRTMYVVPYMMGPVGSPYSKVGFELTDSLYVVANMRIMSRMGNVALDALGDSSSDFVKGVHSVGTLDPKERYIAHFPETREIVSFNSGYGGNALQGKKCFALRIASVQARDEGWLAEHMLILGITNPAGQKKYFVAAFPSACGKTNLAMLVPPESYRNAGWKVETVGDDIAWLNVGPDGRLYAINPEAGFFGVAPGTSKSTNPNAIAALEGGNVIFTNTALDVESNTPWWEALTEDPPAKAIDWLGNNWTPETDTRAAHPNSRFTVPARQCPSIDPEWESPNGVPIEAIIFGGRRKKAAPLVYEAQDWQHGTFVGLTMASEMTAAAAGKIGQLRRDPMAMRPFIGYHVGDYARHWLSMGKKSGSKLPPVYHVNWFRQDANGKFIWPGFGENIRVLEWIFNRVDGSVDAVDSPLGKQPRVEDLNLGGLDLDPRIAASLLEVDPADWKDDLQSQQDFFDQVGDKLPEEIKDEYRRLQERLGL